MTMTYDNLAPLYEQIKRLLLQDLKSGLYTGGSYLPSETELCQKYAVSRITIRRAVSELCADGYLKKVHGRGTLVTAPKLQQTLVSLSGFTETMQNLGRSVRYQVLDSGRHPPGDDILARLEGTGTDRVTAIRRLLIVDDHPLTLEHLFYLEDRYGGVTAAVTAGGSFNDALKAIYGETPAAAERVINVDFPSAAECTLLDCPASRPVYRIEKRVIGPAQRPISVSLLTTPTDRVTYVMRV